MYGDGGECLSTSLTTIADISTAIDAINETETPQSERLLPVYIIASICILIDIIAFAVCGQAFYKYRKLIQSEKTGKSPISISIDIW